MSVERTFYCDGPDCERHVKTRKGMPPVFLMVMSREPERISMHFCGWDCILRYAGQREPEEIIE